MELSSRTNHNSQLVFWSRWQMCQNKPKPLCNQRFNSQLADLCRRAFFFCGFEFLRSSFFFWFSGSWENAQVFRTWSWNLLNTWRNVAYLEPWEHSCFYIFTCEGGMNYARSQTFFFPRRQLSLQRFVSCLGRKIVQCFKSLSLLGPDILKSEYTAGQCCLKVTCYFQNDHNNTSHTTSCGSEQFWLLF